MSFHKQVVTGALAVAVLTGCGENWWSGTPTDGNGGSGSGSFAAPAVEIQDPAAYRRVAVQDSLLVRVRVSDTDAITGVELSGFALRGNPDLGTGTTVAKFETKRIDFAAPLQVTDTIVARFLLATPDTLSDDSVFVVARAFDAGGNSAADTTVIAIGGPRVQIMAPAPGANVRAGTNLVVDLRASDAASRIHMIRVRATGALAFDSTVVIDPSAAEVQRSIVFPVPESASGAAELTASAVTIANDSATSPQVGINVVPPMQDTQPPVLRFSVDAPARAELTDSVYVTVEATDSTQVAEVGLTILPIHRLGTSTDTLTTLRLTYAGENRAFAFALDQLGMPMPADTSTLRIEVTAFASDTAGNCGSATVAETWLSESCQNVGGHTFGPRSGARWEILLVRGTTVPLASGAQIADLASDGTNVFLSNISQNRVDVLPVGSSQITASVSVGSRPWGLAFDRDRQRLYVANSGGTNLSVVSPTSLTEVERIQTPNMKLFDVSFTAEGTALIPSSVTKYDYSDRPQYLGVTQNGNVVYSTVPTATAPDGTVRIYRTAQRRLELVTDYAENRVIGKVIILNADSAFLITADPVAIEVCPRARSADPAIDGTLSETCFTGSVNEVQATIESLGYDTEFHYNKDIAEIGLSDTTYVAISGDHSTVAFGEGATANGRIMVLVDSAGASADDPLYKHGEISDLIGNTAERVIGLALNEDGSLGVARGAEAYFFDRDLRLQGMVGTGTPSGGVDMHPANLSTRRSFVSGVEENGLAYIDVVDSFHFRNVARIFMRDPVTGPIRAVETASGLMIYAVTAGGIVAVEVLTNDL
jgi:YVTN family beta-propeller protein